MFKKNPEEKYSLSSENQPLKNCSSHLEKSSMVKNRAFWAYNRSSTVTLQVFGVMNSDLNQWTNLANTRHSRSILDPGRWFYGLVVPFWAVYPLGTGVVQAIPGAQFWRLPDRDIVRFASRDMCRLRTGMVTNLASLIHHFLSCKMCVKNL